MSERSECTNNNRQDGVLADGDANANEIRPEGEGRAHTLCALTTDTAEQDKVIIWGTDSQCDDPELAEFEMLECQELEAYLVEEGEDFVGLAERKEPNGRCLSLCRSGLEQATDVSNGVKDRKPIALHNATKQEAGAAESLRSREVAGGVALSDLCSEADVFVSCLSSLGESFATAVDTAGRTQTTDSWNVASGLGGPVPEDQTLASLSCNTISERVRATPNPSCLDGTNATQGKDVNWNALVPSEDVEIQAQDRNGIGNSEAHNEEHKMSPHQAGQPSGTHLSGVKTIAQITDQRCSTAATKLFEESTYRMDKSTQADDNLNATLSPSKMATRGVTESTAIKKQGSFDNTLKKQLSFDRIAKTQPSFEGPLKKQHSFDHTPRKPSSCETAVHSASSSLEKRRPWGSPSRPATPVSPKATAGSPRRRPSGSPAKVPGLRALSVERAESPQRGVGQTGKHPAKGSVSSGIPKPVTPQQKEPEAKRSSPSHKPKNVRPKIITYVRKNPTASAQGIDAPLEPMKLTPSSSSSSPSSKLGPQPKASPVLCSSNLLFDKYRQEMQTVPHYPPGVKTPSRKLGAKSGSFHEDRTDRVLQEENVSHDGGTVYRSPRAMRPQLGLGAVIRQPAAKTRGQQTGQCSTTTPNQIHQDPAGEQRRSGPEASMRGGPLKLGPTGLRPPGFSALPATRLAAFGFGRSSSASSVSSSQSSDGTHGDPNRLAQYPPSIHDRPPAPAQPPSAPSLQRRPLAAPRCSPLAARKEMQKEAPLPPTSSPKRFAVVSPKPQSPVRGRTVAGPAVTRAEQRAQEMDRAVIQQLRERCKEQELQLQSLQGQMKKAFLCLDAFAITSQHFHQKNASAIVKERELSLELARIRDEVAFSVAHWEQLQREKEELERRFEAELQRLRAQQQSELGALEERLKVRHAEEVRGLQAQQRAEMEELQMKQQVQMEEMSEEHEVSLMEMETNHNDTVATLQEEHARTVKNLKMAHEQQRKSLEEEFEKIRLSLQDQVDTLTFQNRSLRDRAKRFEEALRKSTDEQIVDALAPYKHIEEDLKSLKDVLEMKNQQIHHQEVKISELEKIAEKNVYLEERLQVLQQQNEDLKERIDKNLAVSRQLSEENANLQVHVEKESNEKKRLSRTNEELLWRLQTGELSPRMSPSSSPVHRNPSLPGSPARPHSYHQ